MGGIVGSYATPVVFAEMGGSGNRFGSRGDDLLRPRQNSLERCVVSCYSDLPISFLGSAFFTII